MKFTMNKDALQRVVNNAGRIINPKSAIPALSCVRITINENAKLANLMASDGGMWLTDVVAVENIEGMTLETTEFLVYYDMLKSALADIPSQPLNIEVSFIGEQVAFTITHDSGCTMIPGRPSDIYPTRPLLDDNVSFLADIEYSVVKRSLQRSVPCVCADDSGTRPVLSGVLFDFLGNGKMNVVATDGRCLIRSTEVTDTESDDARSIIVPLKVAKVLTSLLKDDDVTLEFDESLAVMRCGTMALYFSQVEAKYPNYESVIPTQTHTVKTGRLSLIRAASNVLKFTPQNNYTVFDINGNGKMVLKGEIPEKDAVATDSVDVEHVGESSTLKAAVNGSILLKILNLVHDTNVLFQFTSPDKAFTIQPETQEPNEEVTLMVMPLILEE